MKQDLNRQKPKKLKDRLKENNALTKSVSVIILILVIAGLFAFITMGLRNYNLFILPEFFENLFFGGSGGGEQKRADDSDIYDFLSPDGVEYSGFSIGITLENVREMIAGINPPDNLHLETTAEYYGKGRVSKTVEMSLWKKEGKYKYILKTDGVSEEVYINDGAVESIENHITGGSARRNANINFSFESVPHIKDINYYLDLIESGRIINYEIKRDIEENIINIIYEIEELDQRENIQVSLDNGIVLSVECYTEGGNNLYYKSGTSVKEEYFTGQGPENTAITDNIFMIK